MSPNKDMQANIYREKVSQSWEDKTQIDLLGCKQNPIRQFERKY